MADVLRMPAAVAGETEAVLTAWLVEEGGRFAAQDVVATVETAKATFDVEAEADGVLLRRLVPEGAEVEAGAPIAVTGAAGETEQDAAGLLARLGPAAAPVPAVAQAPREEAPGETASADGAGPERGQRIFISPLARRLARDAGLAIEQLTGTGPDGRIVRRDVEQAITARQAAPAAAPAQPGAGPPAPDTVPAAPETVPPAAAGGGDAHGDGGYTDHPHSRLRRALARRLTESVTTAPHFYLRGTAEVSGLLRLRDQLNAAGTASGAGGTASGAGGTASGAGSTASGAGSTASGAGGTARITLTDLVIKAAAHAHVRVPEMNVIWTPDAVRQFTSVDLSVAVATDGGLVTPVIRAADRLTVGAISAQVAVLAERARSGRLRQDELTGGTATITNLGMYGTQEFAAIINPPQAAILAVGTVRDEPVVRRGKVRPGRLLTVTLSVDHRPVDGVTAARWMAAFTALLAQPAQILL